MGFLRKSGYLMGSSFLGLAGVNYYLNEDTRTDAF